MTQPSLLRGSLVAVVMVTTCVWSSLVWSQCLLPPLDPPGSLASGAYGESVALDGDFMLVGDSTDSTWLPMSGAVHIYERGEGTWVYTETLYPDIPIANALFGFSVAIEDDVVVVGAMKDSTVDVEAGAVYVFRRIASVWVQEQQLLASDANFAGRLGFSVSIEGDLIVAGAYYGLDNDGALYLFRHVGTTWTEEAILTTSANHLGYSTAIVNGIVISGDPLSGLDGVVFVFEKLGASWTLTQLLYPLNPSIGSPPDRFGESIAAHGDWLLVGSIREETAGAAYFFQRQATEYVFETRILPAGLGGMSWFGYGVALLGDTALVGAPLGDVPGASDVGVVLVFEYDGTWTEKAVLQPTLPVVGSQLGGGVLLDSEDLGFAVSTISGLVRPINLAIESCGDEFIRGEANLDFVIDLADVVSMLDYFFAGTPLFCEDSADVNDDGQLDIADPISLVTYLFVSGAPPPAPGINCGADPTLDTLGCEAYPFCP